MSGRVHQKSNRRGVAAVLAVVMILVLFGFGALTLDIGAGQMVRTELQRTADAAALAAVQDLRGSDPAKSEAMAIQSALDFVRRNPVLNRQPVYCNPTRDIVLGKLEESGPGEAVQFSPWVAPYNAVRVTVHYPLEYYLARIFAGKGRMLHATALAAVPPPRQIDVIPAALPVPGFGPVDPDYPAHNPGKTSPSEPADGQQFQIGEEVAVFIFGKGPMPSVHLVLDMRDAEGVSDMNNWLATADALGGEREPFAVSVGDELPVWNTGTGNQNFGEKLETRITNSDPADDTVIMPIIETTEVSRDLNGDLTGNVRIVDFVAVELTEIRAVKIPDPTHLGKLMTVNVLYGNVVERMVGTGNGIGTTSGTFTLGSVRSMPALVM
ncbi:MAG: hypothetical protein HY763_00760 [Planctomycetes bacterium]|nr:hypothetical protein [Planctomycetota bacterium]